MTQNMQIKPYWSPFHTQKKTTHLTKWPKKDQIWLSIIEQKPLLFNHGHKGQPEHSRAYRRAKERKTHTLRTYNIHFWPLIKTFSIFETNKRTSSSVFNGGEFVVLARAFRRSLGFDQKGIYTRKLQKPTESLPLLFDNSVSVLFWVA